MEDYANGNSNVATVTAEQCKIIHIPDKPPVPPHLQPTVSVHAAVIEPKHANALVRNLNQMVPMENFRHVKRVRKKCLDGGKIELSVILCLASECEDQWDGMPKDVLELIKQYQLSTFVTKVCKYAASTKEEWEEQCKLWPTSYHPPTYNISGITGFTEEEAQSVLGFMQYTVDLAKSSSDMVVNAAVIVDPSTKQVISSACDQVLSLTIPRNKTGIKSSCLNHHEVTTSIEAEKPQVVLSCHSSCDPEQLYNSVSCLHPWQWTEQLSPISSGSWHPLQHAAMVAIEYSAARDRLLFPNSGNRVDELVQKDIMLSDTTCLPSKRQKVDCNKTLFMYWL